MNRLLLPVLNLLQRSLLVAQLEQAAQRDAKTGLLNAAYWHTLAGREVARALRRAEPLVVLMIDLDHFKDINDVHGHLVGDQVLRSVAQTLTAAVREYDVVGRFGGEEFVVLLPATGHAAAQPLAERLRRSVAEIRVRAEPSREPVALTTSIGAASWDATSPVTDGSASTEGLLTDLLQAADAAVYAAKNAGRDRVIALRVGTHHAAPLHPHCARQDDASPTRTQ